MHTHRKRELILQIFQTHAYGPRAGIHAHAHFPPTLCGMASEPTALAAAALHLRYSYVHIVRYTLQLQLRYGRS